MRYKVTGGTDGLSGISVGDRRYEAGDIVEMAGTKAQWLVDKGLLEVADKKVGKSAEPTEDEDIEAPPADDAAAGDDDTEGNE